MKKFALFLVVMLVVLASTSIVMANEGKDVGKGWAHYGDVLVYWELADCDGANGTDPDGYQYWWGVDRNLNGIPGEGLVEVDYGKYGGILSKTEPCYEHFCYTDFGCYVGLDNFIDKVIHLTEGWVPGVTVPGEVNRFVVKDNDGDGIYTGGHSTILFWDGMTLQGDPPGPYNIQNKFEYTFNATGDGGQVIGGNYLQMQYLMIPED